MKKRLVFIISLVAFLGLFQSCDMIYDIATSIVDPNGNSEGEYKPSSTSLKQEAYNNAKYYIGQHVIYPKSVIPTYDCSDFVSNCYVKAAKSVGTKILLDENATVETLWNRYTNHVSYDQVEQGDIIFIDYNKNDGLNNKATHVGIYNYYDRRENKIHFIDSTNWGDYSESKMNAVQDRTIPKNDKRIMGYGVVKTRY